MVACGKYLRGDVMSCTRGDVNCVCKTKIEKIQTAVGAHDWHDYGTYELAENIVSLIVQFVNEETQACADICKELYLNDAITCSDEIEERLIIKGHP